VSPCRADATDNSAVYSGRSWADPAGHPSHAGRRGAGHGRWHPRRQQRATGDFDRTMSRC